jgi:beta-N-acetylhexosaminidase
LGFLPAMLARHHDPMVCIGVGRGLHQAFDSRSLASGEVMTRNSIDPGQLLMVGIPGLTLDRSTRRSLVDTGPCGVILFRRNAHTPAQLRRLCSAIHRLCPGSLIAIDHEGGRVNRLPQPFTAFPAARALGTAASPRLAFAVGRAMGRELSSVGIDLDFAPVLDVLTHPRNRVIGDRAFGSDPATVAQLGIAFARGLRAAGVIPCGKHFPGHGASRGDSHVVLPRIGQSSREILRTHVAPFRAAIAAGIPCLMVAHVVYQGLDSKNAASLSPRILDGLLRRRLKYRGLIVSDDIEMAALSRRMPPEEAAVRAVAAGTDMLLVCSSLEVARRARLGLEQALKSGRLPLARVREALNRIRRLQARRPARAPIRRWPIAAHTTLASAIG